jgi:hypothetical protein
MEKKREEAIAYSRWWSFKKGLWGQWRRKRGGNCRKSFKKMMKPNDEGEDEALKKMIKPMKMEKKKL